jgi:hypothetical protein
MTVRLLIPALVLIVFRLHSMFEPSLSEYRLMMYATDMIARRAGWVFGQSRSWTTRFQRNEIA